MSSRTIRMNDSIDAYLRGVSVRETDVQRRLREETAALVQAGMQICPEQGQLMRMLTGLVGARRAIEVGVFTGYSALCVALALPADGELVACDVNEEWTAIARRYWSEAGWPRRSGSTSRPRTGPSTPSSAKGEAGSSTWRSSMPTRRATTCTTSAAWSCSARAGWCWSTTCCGAGAVADESDRSEDTVALRAFNAKLGDDARIDLCMLPVGDGLTIARKLG